MPGCIGANRPPRKRLLGQQRKALCLSGRKSRLRATSHRHHRGIVTIGLNHTKANQVSHKRAGLSTEFVRAVSNKSGYRRYPE
jgi:hypothetical protein